MQKNVSKNPEIVQKFAVQRNADLKLCRARKMLKNAPTLAIGHADTAENGPSKVRQVSNEIRHNIGDKIFNGGIRVPLRKRQSKSKVEQGQPEVPSRLQSDHGLRRRPWCRYRTRKWPSAGYGIYSKHIVLLF